MISSMITVLRQVRCALMSKFIVVSDIHFHNWKPHPANFKSRLDEQKEFMYYLASYARDNNIKHVFNCGDTFHLANKVDTEVLFSANQALAEISAATKQPVISITGNHDSKQIGTLIHNISASATQWSCNITICKPIESRDFYLQINSYKDRENCTPTPFSWFAIPYTTNKDFLRLEFRKVEAFKHPCFVFMHQGVSSVPMGSGFVIDEIFDPKMIPDNVIHAFTGHYHSHKKVAPNLTVVGSPMQHTKADEGEDKGFLVVDGETGEYERVLNEISPKFKTFSWDYVKCFSQMDQAELAKEVFNSMIEVVDVPHNVNVDDTRSLLTRMGAYSIEFSREEQIPIKLESNVKGFNLDQLVVEISKDLTPEYQEVDRKIRSGEYNL